MKFVYMLVFLVSAFSLAFATDIDSCMALNVPGSTYTLTGNVYSNTTCFTVAAPGVTLDCNGFSITGDNMSGMYAPIHDKPVEFIYGIYSELDGTVIKNCVISNFGSGIRFEDVYNGLIFNSTVSSTAEMSDSIDIERSSNINISNVKAYSDKRAAIMLHESKFNSISDSTGKSRLDTGLSVWISDNNLISNYTGSSAGSEGIWLQGSSNNIISNSVGISNYDGMSYMSDGIAFTYGSDNNRLYNSIWKAKTGFGITLSNSINNILDNCTGTSETGVADTQRGAGILLAWVTTGSIITNSTAIGSPYSYGIFFDEKSANNTLYGSTITAGSSPAVYLFGSLANRIIQNNIRGRHAISVQSSNYAVDQYNLRFPNDTVQAYCDNNVFLGNNITSDNWVDNTGRGNIFNDSTHGNIYYFANGTPSWQVYNISDTDRNNYADVGSDMPFSKDKTGNNWAGIGADWHPYSLNQIGEQNMAPPTMPSESNSNIKNNASAIRQPAKQNEAEKDKNTPQPATTSENSANTSSEENAKPAEKPRATTNEPSTTNDNPKSPPAVPSRPSKPQQGLIEGFMCFFLQLFGRAC